MKIPIVDEEDNLIEYKEKKDLLPTDINRDAGLWVVNEFNEILLAQRSLNKKRQPGMWTVAVAGTIEDGETYESNIIKEAEEEIGLKNIKPKFLYKTLKDEKGARRMRVIFEVKIPKDTPLKLEPMEVMDVKWFKQSEIENLIKEKSEMFPESFYTLYHKYITDYANQS